MTDFILQQPTGRWAPLLRIVDEDQRTLLALDVRDGRLVAEYDDDDLDESARRLVAELLRMAEVRS